MPASGEKQHDSKINQIDSLTPTSVRHIIGQRVVMEQVTVALDAAAMDQTRMDHALLVGSAGLGKTAVAHVIACEMGTDLHEVLGQSITSVAELNSLLLRAKDNDCVHIDEAHQLSKRMQTALYIAIDQKRLMADWGAGPQSIPVADFTLLLSTTDEHCLLQPLRDRARLVLRFGFYSPDELRTILELKSRSLGWSVEDAVFTGIAERAKGTPRLALRLLQASYRVCRAGGDTAIVAAHLRRACALAQLDDLGLDPLERDYLKLLRDGHSRLNILVSVLGTKRNTVADVVEPILIRLGLIAKDDHGRRLLTAEGRTHVSDSCPIEV